MTERTALILSNGIALLSAPVAVFIAQTIGADDYLLSAALASPMVAALIGGSIVAGTYW